VVRLSSAGECQVNWMTHDRGNHTGVEQMTEGSSESAKVPPQGKVKPPFFSMGNEVLDVFLPIIGPDCYAVYSRLVRSRYANQDLVHSIRGLADETGLSVTTISRSLEVLELVGLLKLTRFHGSRDSECQLRDSRALASGLGAQYNPRTLSFSIPPDAVKKLKAEVNLLRKKQQGKSPAKAPNDDLLACENQPQSVSPRNAGVSLEIPKRPFRETQTASLLIQEEGRFEEGPPPTPAHRGEAKNENDSTHKSGETPDEDEPASLLKSARIIFTGVMDDLGDNLFSTNRPVNSRLANGAADWQEFGFDSLAVDGVTRRGEALALTVSASDSEKARLGLEKYRRTFFASLHSRYGCQVEIALVKAPRQTSCSP
jgi:hypothetical protein